MPGQPSFVVYDPLALDDPARQPSWYPSLRAILEGRFGLPWTHDVDEAGRARCTLVLTSELDAATCARLAPAGSVIVLFSGIYAQKFTAVVPEIDALLAEERSVCEWMDLAIVPSQYAKELLMKAYGAHLEPKLTVTGWPIDIDAFAGAPAEPRDMQQILLGQRQDYDKNFLLEADLCTELVARGYRLVRASSKGNPLLDDFSRYAERHLGVPSRGQPDRYVSQCRQSGFVLMTSPAETLCITAIEAIAAGCIPVVPDHSAFREWCHAANRYDPYSIADILRILREAPVHRHRIAQYRPERYIERLRAVVADGLRWTRRGPRVIPSHS